MKDFVFNKYIKALGLSLWLILPVPASFSVESNLYDVQTVYFFNVMKFTIWPDDNFNNEDVFYIGLLGEDQVTKVMREKLTHRKIQSRNIQLQTLNLKSLRALNNKEKKFHVVYVSEAMFTPEVKKELQNMRLLVLGNYNKFIQEGGMVSVFYDKDKDRIAVHINLRLIKEQGIQIGSNLLSIASVVNQ
ncbi:MAG: YfiR family protein [Pseudomonadales bacterium]|nr:YfiR family protein [Pseudomonadales bacterium]